MKAQVMSPKDAPWEVGENDIITDGSAENAFTRDHFGIHSNTGVSDIVFAMPFRLLSRDACYRMGEEIVMK
jgi:hypothetical protein